MGNELISTGAIYLLIQLTLIFLKVLGVVGWSWTVVFVPSYIYLSLVLLVLVLILIVLVEIIAWKFTK